MALRVEAKLILGYSLPGTPYLLASPPPPIHLEKKLFFPGGSPKRKKEGRETSSEINKGEKEIVVLLCAVRGMLQLLNFIPCSSGQSERRNSAHDPGETYRPD